MTAFIVWRRRKSGGVQTASAINQAIKTGVLPADASVESWEPFLQARERSVNRARWTSPIFCALLAALGMYLILSNSRTAALGSVCTILFVGFGVYSIVVANRQLPKIRALINQLPHHQLTTPPTTYP